VRGAIELDYLDLVLSTALVVVAGLVSIALRLGITGRLAWASARAVVQLLLVGYVLNWVFDLREAPLVVLLLLVMIGAASVAAVGRSSRVFAGIHAATFLTLVLTGAATTFSVTSLVIEVDPWFRPQYVIPLLGMVLGNGLTGISLSLDSLLAALDEGADRIEMELSLGATRWEAVRDPLREAVRRGMVPIINAMIVAGIVSLPGMMTGQILEGADPIDAVKYQILIIFMIAGSTSTSCILIGLVVYRRLFNERHQLRRERIGRRE